VPAKAAKKAPVQKATKPVAKTAPVAKKVAKAPAPQATATVAKPVAEKKRAMPAKQGASASKQQKQEAAKPAVVRSPFAPRPVGKVAVAVVSRAPTPPPKTKYKVVPYKTDELTGRPILPKDYRPSGEEEYMSPLQTEYFRQRLLDWRSDLVEESKQTIENLKDEVRDVGDEAERATRETENSLELRTRDRYRKLIGKIDSTLKRLEAGDYGYCADTGEEIGLERLEARLTAERTIDAQERWEHMQKQQGD
jgi:DnaK suppressor protein